MMCTASGRTTPARSRAMCPSRVARRGLLAGALLAMTVISLQVAFAAPAGASPAGANPAASNAADRLSTELVAPPLAQVAIQRAKLLAPSADTEQNSFFDYSVALDGDTALVGCRAASPDSVLGAGAVYVFTRVGGTWTLQQTLTAGDKGSSDHFGSSVALSGSIAVIGASHAAGGASGTTARAGAVYVFSRADSTWVQQRKLCASDAEEDDHLGASVAFDGTTILAGAPDVQVDGTYSVGAAYVFSGGGSIWSEQAKLTAASGERVQDAGFGTSVAIDGNTALIGAPTSTGGASGTTIGAAYVFTCSAGSWTERADLAFFTTDRAVSDRFGGAVVLDGGTALVGALTASPGGVSHAGAVYAFTGSGSSWSLQSTLLASDKAESDAFGSALALDGDTALIGAFGANPDSVGYAGAAYAFTRSGEVWSQDSKLVAADKTAMSCLGYAVDLDGDTALVGAPLMEVDGKARAGGAYVFALVNDSTAPTTTATGLAADAASGWTNTAVTVGLSADDGTGSGVAGVHYTIDGGAEQTVAAATASFTVSDQGNHTIHYWSVDVAGNVESAKTGFVNIDATKPVTKADAASVVKGKKGKLAYRVNDATPTCGKAKVTLKVYKGRKLKKTIKVPDTVACNVKKSYSWRCPLAKGRYTVKVFATDIAGNKQSKVGSASLTVR